MKKHETLIVIVLSTLVALAYWFFLFSAAGAAIPPEKPVYQDHALAYRISEAKAKLIENFKARGCQEVQIAVWREGEEVFIEARCLD